MTPDELVALLDRRGLRPKPTGPGQWQALCPAHDDRNPSLSVGTGKGGDPLLTCFADCEVDDVLARLGLSKSDLFASNGNGNGNGAIDYLYQDEHGKVAMKVQRKPGKKFAQARPDGTGDWIWKLDGVTRVIYRLPKVLAAVAAGETIYVAEGEKDVHALERAGVVATTNPGGAGKWNASYSKSLAGANVVVVSDRDDDQQGIRHARAVVKSLQAEGCTVRIVEAAKGKDPHDHLAAGLGVEDFREISDAGQPPEPADPVTDPDEDEPDAELFAAPSKVRRTFVAPKLAEKLRAEAPVAVGGEQLYVYRDGAYRPDGERRLRQRITEELGKDWSRARAQEVIGFLYDSSQRIWEQPPRDIVNCANGLLNVNTFELEPHTPDHLSPVQIGASFDPGATCPAINKFFKEVFPSDAVAIARELAGYLITPDNSLQVAAMLRGRGANGKSTYLTLLRCFAGPENVCAHPLHELDENRFASAELYGKLANVFADLDARALKSSSMFKAITGGDPIQGERKFRPAFTFVPYARLLFSANAAPPSSDSSDAFFRRWEVIPFERTFPIDTTLIDRLTTPAELSGLLSTALPALVKIRAAGHLSSSATTEKANKQFRIDTDSITAFIDERCAHDPDAEISRTRLFDSYRNWCTENNRMAFSAQRFYERLRAPELKITEVTVKGERRFRGVGLVRT